MNNNYFVGCGGTGAHVMLAMIRLHILGYPFGLFTKNPVNKFPDLILIDQDQTPSDGTASKKVIDLLKDHPGRLIPEELFRSNRLPTYEVITPLPDGAAKKWPTGDQEQLKDRFTNDSLFDLMTDRVQKTIQYSKGMMASPAVGSMIFKLKEQDLDDSGTDYTKLLNNLAGNPVVVCGSIVGGTGASVTPTLADTLHDKNAKVMSVLIHRWFELRETDTGDHKNKDAVKRNSIMMENASTGLAFSGENLANRVATVLVGVPHLVPRDWYGDNQQPSCDSYAHAVAAIAGMRHLLDRSLDKGLYGVCASDNSKLTDDIRIDPTEDSILGVLFGQASLLVHILNVYCDTLEKYDQQSKKLNERKSLGRFLNVGSKDYPKLNICQWVLDGVNGDISQIKDVIIELNKIIKIYEDKKGKKGILRWLRKLGIADYDPDRKSHFHFELNHIERIRETLNRGNEGLPPIDDQTFENFNLNNRITIAKKAEFIALSLFHWTAKWIKDSWTPPPVDGPKVAGSGYWPMPNDAGLDPNWTSKPGEFGEVDGVNIGQTIDNYYKLSNISSNGWAHPVSVVQYFKFLLKKKDDIAIRKLQLLFVGYTTQVLTLQKIGDSNTGNTLSFDKLVKSYNPSLATHQLVHYKSKKIYGFNSPDTLFCPVPDTSNEDWLDLWQEINGNTANDNWEKSTNWLGHARESKNIITFWAENFKGDGLGWSKPLIDKNFSDPTPFGIADLLSVTGKKRDIPLPILGYSSKFPRGYPSISFNDPFDRNILKDIPDLTQFEGYSIIENASFPNDPTKVNLIWKDHLDALQTQKKIFAWGLEKTKNQTWVMIRADGDFKVININNLRVIDLESITIQHCIPLKHNPVPGSSSNLNKGDLKFPDLPILPDYIGLVNAPPDGQVSKQKLIDSNWKGISRYKTNTNNTDVTWEVHFDGRPGPESITVANVEEATQAHWMIWPNFKSKAGISPWKAYYIYEHSKSKDLEAEVMAFDQQNGQLSLYDNQPQNCGPRRALKFNSGQHETAGAPIAISAYDHDKKEHVGLYMIQLKEYDVDNAPSPWQVAIDFGTSHTVAAQLNPKTNQAEPVELDAELGKNQSQISLHVSENWPDIPSQVPEMQLEMWRPTYIEINKVGIHKSVVPTDLWSTVKIDGNFPFAQFKNNWQPMTDYSIPIVRLERKDSHDHVISGFKWKETFTNKFSNEDLEWFQERYLRMVIEVFVADMIIHNNRLPREIQFTFTYPLRATSDGSIQIIERAIKQALTHSSADLGFKLIPDGNNYFKFYSESHAAADVTGKKNFGEVKLVADLGGGTLDVFISTNPQNKNDERFEKAVAYSVRIGGDLLLDQLADEKKNYLPKEKRAGWGTDKETRKKNLRAWMRLKGSEKLFSPSAVNEKSKELGLSAFNNKPDSEKSRTLITRYFGLITDFLARSIVAYISTDVYPKLKKADQESHLTLNIRIQGNGWRLWYGSSSYSEIQSKIEEAIKSIAENLLKDIKSVDPSLHSEKPDLWVPNKQPLGQIAPKVGPILNAIDKEPMNPYETDDKCFTFPLCNVTLLEWDGEGKIIAKDWFATLPFVVPESTSLQINKFNPPLNPDHLLVTPQETYEEVDNTCMNKINTQINKQKNYDPTLGLFSPIAAIIWEEVFGSDTFKKI